jgi:glycosidase
MPFVVRTLPIFALLLSTACAPLPVQAQQPTSATMVHAPWTRSANIYEVNIRQYTKEGTFNAFATHLPRLRKMGVDILWLMPVHPIGVKNRKGTLGSYYAVRDYTAVNPEFGTMDDFKRLVKQAQGLGMRVIIDWVANHTAFDNPWTVQHKDWYLKDAKGEIFPVTYTEGPEPEYWTDVTGLDWTQKGLWKGMTDAMAFWVREAGIDGFRCDVAAKVPTAFWEQARVELEKIRPMFMLAEAWQPELHGKAFDMTYGWDSLGVFKDIAKGKSDARALRALFEKPPVAYPQHAYRMRFTSNHDENSWHGSDVEHYGKAFQAMAVLAATLPGMPLIYGGQEAGLDKRLEFFEKDPIVWKEHPNAQLYAWLLKLKHENPALWNGQYGGGLKFVETGNDKVVSYRREKDRNVVAVTVNLSGVEQQFAGAGGKREAIKPWAYQVSGAVK